MNYHEKSEQIRTNQNKSKKIRTNQNKSKKIRINQNKSKNVMCEPKHDFSNYMGLHETQHEKHDSNIFMLHGTAWNGVKKHGTAWNGMKQHGTA
jgi:hypothetical protein